MNRRTDHNEQVLDQFTQQAEGYTKLTTGLRPRGQDEALALLGAGADDIALDVACGSGGLTIPVAGLVKHVTGVDLTPAMIEQGRAIQADLGIANIEWIVADVDPLPFEDACFSLVMCSAAFHHFERPRSVLREMARVCRSGGRIAVRDVAPPPEKMASYDAIEIMRDPSHVHAHSVPELLALADGLYLAEVAVEQYLAADIPLEAVLATSYPTEHSIESIRALVEEDARSGEDRFGLQPCLTDGAMLVSYPMVTIVWRK